MPVDFESARRKYKPVRIEFLLVAEAPPREGSGRFFYFENVRTGDSLFLETIKVLYPTDFTMASIVRQNKKEFLERFKIDGFYLIDACDPPLEDSRPAMKRQAIRKSLPSLRVKLQQLAVEGVKIILISATVYEVCYHVLKSAGFNIINEEPIDFPGSGGQAKFREKLNRLLEKHGWTVDQ